MLDRNGIFAETPKYISVKIGFLAEIIRFRPKLFGFGVLAGLFRCRKSQKAPKCRNRNIIRSNTRGDIGGGGDIFGGGGGGNDQGGRKEGGSIAGGFASFFGARKVSAKGFQLPELFKARGFVLLNSTKSNLPLSIC